MNLLTAFLVSAGSTAIVDFQYYLMGIEVPVGIIGHAITIGVGTFILTRLPK